MALLKIKCPANHLKAETKLAADEKVKSGKIFCRKHAATSNGICLNDVEDYSKEGWKKNKVNMIGEDDVFTEENYRTSVKCVSQTAELYEIRKEDF